MFVITGITGRVGGAAARRLLEAGLPVRGVVRDAAKGVVWGEQGCEIALADMGDAQALATAFQGAEGVFIVPPPVFDPRPGFPEARATVAAVRQALEAAKPGRVVWLSTVGAQADQPNLLSQHTLMEAEIADLALPLTILRPAWFMDNAMWDVPAAREGVLDSFLAPLDRAIPMVAAKDVGDTASDLLRETWTGRRIVELEGPAQVSPNGLAVAFARALQRPVQARIVPRETWGGLFRDQGMADPLPRIQMLDGFNEGWLTFEGQPRKGSTTLDAVLAGLV